MRAQRLPAYARDLSEARKRGKTLRNPCVTIALHWRARPVHGYGLVVPDEDDPGTLDWTFLRGLEVLLYRYERDTVERVRNATNAIRRAHPKRLMVVDMSAEKIVALVRAC